MPDSENIDVVVVVSGQPQRIKVNVHQTLEVLVRDALRMSGNQGQPPGDWDLRTEDGRPLDQSTTVEAANLQDGMTLFLSPKTGAGGS